MVRRRLGTKRHDGVQRRALNRQHSVIAFAKMKAAKSAASERGSAKFRMQGADA